MPVDLSDMYMKCVVFMLSFYIAKSAKIVPFSNTDSKVVYTYPVQSV